MTGLRKIVVKFVAFAAVSVLLLVVLLNTMLNGLGGDARSYHAELTDVSGLRVGDDVRVAGVRVGRVRSISIADGGALVGFDLLNEQPILDNTSLVMRYQNLLGQRYLALVQPKRRGAALEAGATIPVDRTSPGFDLTELLNGFRPLFEALRPEDVNQLASSLVTVLQGEGGTVESLLGQTAQLTNFVADRDDLIGEVLVNLTPVLDNLAAQGEELDATVVELRRLMRGLARDRTSIGRSIDGVSELVVSTSDLLDEARVPLVRATGEFRVAARMLSDSRERFVRALEAFGLAFGALGRGTSYENALNVYLCSVVLKLAGQSVNLGGGQDGPYSEVCR